MYCPVNLHATKSSNEIKEVSRKKERERGVSVSINEWYGINVLLDLVLQSRRISYKTLNRPT
jgi:hypothetical protein